MHEWNTLTDNTKTQGVKIRLCHVYKRADQKNTDIMKEVNALSAEDLADFARLFNEAGFPTTPPA